MKIFNSHNYLGMASSRAVIKPLKVQSSYISLFIRFWEHKHLFNRISSNYFNAIKKHVILQPNLKKPDLIKHLTKSNHKQTINCQDN
jgi:hypothetical protein